MIPSIEDEIIRYLDDGKHVYIENGCLVDQILSYSIKGKSIDREVIFTTSASVFFPTIRMGTYSYIDTEEYKGVLYVSVSY